MTVKNDSKNIFLAIIFKSDFFLKRSLMLTLCNYQSIKTSAQQVKLSPNFASNIKRI